MYKNHSDDQLTSAILTQAESGKKRARSAAPPVPVPSPESKPTHMTKTTAVVNLETESKGLHIRPVLGFRPTTEYTFEVKATNKRKINKDKI